MDQRLLTSANWEVGTPPLNSLDDLAFKVAAEFGLESYADGGYALGGIRVESVPANKVFILISFIVELHEVDSWFEDDGDILIKLK
jgi:hypothetical protein